VVSTPKNGQSRDQKESNETREHFDWAIQIFREGALNKTVQILVPNRTEKQGGPGTQTHRRKKKESKKRCRVTGMKK